MNKAWCQSVECHHLCWLITDISKRPGCQALDKFVVQHVSTFLKPMLFAVVCGEHIHIVNAGDGTVAFNIKLFIFPLAVSPCRQHLAASCHDEWLLILDVNTSEIIHRKFLSFMEQPTKAQSLAYAPNKQALAVGCDNGILRIIDTSSWEAIASVRLTKDLDRRGKQYVESVVYAPNGENIAAHCGGIVFIINCSRPLAVIDCSRPVAGRCISCLAYRPNGQDLAIVAHAIQPDAVATQLLILNTETLETRMKREAEIQTYACAYRPCGQHLALISQNDTGLLSVLDADSLGIVYNTRIRSDLGEICSVAYSSCGQKLVIGTGNGALTIMDAESGANIHVIHLQTYGVNLPHPFFRVWSIVCIS